MGVAIRPSDDPGPDDLPVVVVSLIGVTNGLEVFSVPTDTRPPEKDEWVEVSSAEVTLSSDEDVYVVRRRIHGDRVITWIGVYRLAYEIGDRRPGGYYGAGLWLSKVPVHPIGLEVVAVLSWLREQVQQRAMKCGRFTRRLASLGEAIDLTHIADGLMRIADSLQQPPLAALDADVERLPTGFIDAHNLEKHGITLDWLLDWSLDGGALFGNYSRVVIGLHSQAFSFVPHAPGCVPLQPSQLRQTASLRATELRRQLKLVMEAEKSNAKGAESLSYEDRAEAPPKPATWHTDTRKQRASHHNQMVRAARGRQANEIRERAQTVASIREWISRSLTNSRRADARDPPWAIMLTLVFACALFLLMILVVLVYHKIL